MLRERERVVNAYTEKPHLRAKEKKTDYPTGAKTTYIRRIRSAIS